nr:hypothetical protein [Tanacetum cinerariifolium]
MLETHERSRRERRYLKGRLEKLKKRHGLIFFVCIMRPSSFDIQIQESEIEAAEIEQYKIEIMRLRNLNIGTTKSASRLVEPIHPRYVDYVLGYEKEKMKFCELKHKYPKHASSQSLVYADHMLGSKKR